MKLVALVIGLSSLVGCASSGTFVAPRPAGVTERPVLGFYVSQEFPQYARDGVRAAASEWRAALSAHVDIVETTDESSARFVFAPGDDAPTMTDQGPVWACGYTERVGGRKMFINVAFAGRTDVCRGGIRVAALHEMGHALGLGHDALKSLMVDGSGARQSNHIDVFTRNELARAWGVPKETIGFVSAWNEVE